MSKSTPRTHPCTRELVPRCFPHLYTIISATQLIFYLEFFWVFPIFSTLEKNMPLYSDNEALDTIIKYFAIVISDIFAYGRK